MKQLVTEHAKAQEAGASKQKITCESAFREQGIDEVLIARKLKDLVEAKDRRWNPKKQSWVEFDDHGRQLAAIREIVKIFGGYPSRSENDEAPVIITDWSDIFPPRGSGDSDGRERSER